MSNARDDNDGLKRDQQGRHPGSILAPSEEIGQMHYSTENYSTAIEYFTKALESPDLKDFPDRFRIYLRIADCHRKKGKTKEAWKLLDQARALIGDHPAEEVLGKIEYREAYVLFAQGKYDEALRIGFSAYRRLKHSTEHTEVADVQLLVANCYHRLGMAGHQTVEDDDLMSRRQQVRYSYAADVAGTTYDQYPQCLLLVFLEHQAGILSPEPEAVF